MPRGRLALAAAEAEPPDLILLDINMPDMNGYEVCERLKTHPQLKDIPVLFISALNETLDKVKAFALGGLDYITKPFQVEEVEARVRTHLELRRMQRDLEGLVNLRTRQLAEAKGRLAILDKTKSDFLSGSKGDGGHYGSWLDPPTTPRSTKRPPSPLLPQHVHGRPFSSVCGCETLSSTASFTTSLVASTARILTAVPPSNAR